LRRFVRPDGHLFYTLFVDEPTEGGHGWVDHWTKAMVAADKPGFEAAVASRLEDPEPPDYRDAIPDDPLRVAMYSRRHAMELIEGTGWELVSLSPPDVHLQHHIVCSPERRAP
jgi:hypothetical protein